MRAERGERGADLGGHRRLVLRERAVEVEGDELRHGRAPFRAPATSAATRRARANASAR